MTQSIVSGLYQEDFNYGYPYTFPGRTWRTLPPQFNYNHEAITARGVLQTSARFKAAGRAAFTICYLSKATEPNNLDLGAHSGAHNAAPYYLLFPAMLWGEVVVLDLVITLTADGDLQYDRSWDGVAGDRFVLVVNGHERLVHTRTAGHNWTTDVVPLRKGRNRIQWVVQTKKYVPPTTRSGTSVANPSTPRVLRYFRLCRLTISTVSAFPAGTIGNFGTPVYAEFGSQGSTSVGTATFVGRKGKRGQCVMKGYGTALYKGKNAVDNMVGGATTTFSPRQSVRATSAMFGTSAFGPTGAISFTHSAYDAQLELTSTGALTVEVPFNTPQAVTSLIRNLQSISFTMSTPVFVNGKPITPKYQDIQNFNATSSGAYVYTDPVSPSSINHVYPIAAPKYRWITTDIGGVDDSNVTSWPEHVTPGTNPAWVSNSVYAPTIHPHEHFVDRDATYVTYSRTLHFYDHFGEHMWMTMPATAFPTTVTNVTPFQPYTWVFVAMLHPIMGGDEDRSHTLLDSYLNSATPADYSQQIADDEDTTANDGTGAFRSMVKFRRNAVTMSSNTATTLTRPWVMNYKPCVYIAVFNQTTSSLTAYGHNYMQRVVGPTGSASNYQQGFMMGRTNGHFNRRNFTTMTIFETAFYNRVLSGNEKVQLADYLAGVYQFQKYR